MVPTAKRELIHAQDEWPMALLRTALESALAGSGPALGFGEISSTSVPSDVALVVTTSGSTGKAKEINLSAAALISSAKAANQYLNGKIGNSWSLLLPLTHIAGINVLLRAIQLESEVIDNRNVTEYAVADFTAIVPTQLHRALTVDNKLLKHLQQAQAVLVGGAPLSKEDNEKANAFGINVVTTYGMSETSGGCVYNGVPLKDVLVKVENNIIFLRGPMLADVALEDGWFRTSDFGEFENGKLTVFGRLDDQIISGGEKISLSAIERALNENFKGAFIAFAKPDQEWGERLCIATTLELSQDTISHFLKNKFGGYATPKEIHKVAEIPVTAIGKPDRVKLIERLAK
ncbi:MAG: AMP-binding protein [Acidobacteria bacterium]|nr:AMP-binding protein [Acidobacteriota bacterium]